MKQSLRMLLRDWRAGELSVLAMALVVAVASITSVGFFADRVSRALVRDAHQLLGADLVLVSDHPWQPGIAEEISRRGLERAQAMTFISMAINGDVKDAAEQRAQLAGVKAVTQNYPLRGRLRIAPAPNAPDAAAKTGPEPGTVWIEERLVTALAAPVGSMLKLGDATLKVAAIITLEPERGVNFFNIAPRLFMNLADVPATGLVQVGSRVSYHLYAAGAREPVAALETWAKARLERGQRVDNLENGRPEVRGAIERAQRFLGLTALLSAILAGVAIALGTRRFVERHLDGCAVMRCYGATQAKLLSLFGLEFILLGVFSCAAGTAAGYVAQNLIAEILGGLLRADLPAASLLPAVQGFLVGLVLLLGFALPPLVQLKNVPAVHVIRRESGSTRGGTIAVYAAGMAALSGLLIWQAGDLQMGITIVGGFGVAVLAFALVAWLGLRFAASGPIARRLGAGSVALRYGLANLRRHARGNAVQVASLALGLTAVLLLTFTRNDLVDAWRRSSPPDAPNRFLLGVQPDQLAEVKAFFAGRGIAVPDFNPMVRGRLTAVNGRKVSEDDFTEERARRLVEREFNLSFADRPPAYNTVSEGRWFAPGSDEISVEAGIAKTLRWTMGDELTFKVGGESFVGRITSVRKLHWDSMKVNFFVIGPPSLIGRFPASYISAFRLDPGKEQQMNELTARFPNLTLVDVGAVVRQAQGIVDRVISAVQVVFAFALGAGLLVLYSALVATEDERRREAAVMRVYGASRAQVTGSQRVEFLAMGLLAGLLATAGAAAIGQLLARRVFELDLPPSAGLWIAGPLAGVLLLSLNAWLSARKVLSASPALTLRDSV
ncbi:MAG TPA: FtsX-like permease family protein [Burkholderiales bacterium]|nr:FtsX-like permease family protein [Burkholderiales bacterium]